MADKLTFKDYVSSKDQLRSAITNTPQRIAEYEVRTYCKLPVGETKADKEHVNLRPKHKIIVEWLYEDVDNPTPLGLRFEGPADSDPSEERSALWKGDRLLKWLLRNTRENT